MKKLFIVFITLISFLFSTPSFAVSQNPDSKNDEPVGEFSGLGIKVSRGNYYFSKSAIMVFGTKWGVTPQTPQELEDRVWEDLLFSFEAFRRDIKVDDKELQEEIDKMLSAEKVTFDRKKDDSTYVNWIKEKTGEPKELFENQLRHLIQLQKLRQQVMDGITPTVTEDEAFQEFLNEYNTLSVEMAQFENAQDAKNFYAKVKNKPKLWEKETKENPKLFRRPGFVALEFLMDMWKFPKDDLYKMMKLNIGTIYPPIPIYSGKYGVCRVVEKRVAEESKFPEVRQSYYKQLEMKKKYDGLMAWIKQLKDEAEIKPYKTVEVLPKEQEKK